MSNEDTGLDIVLRRITSCPACRQPLRMLFDNNVLQLYCYAHGYFTVEYVKSSWSITYKFPEGI
jgi:hypothetical protein